MLLLVWVMLLQLALELTITHVVHTFMLLYGASKCNTVFINIEIWTKNKVFCVCFSLAFQSSVSR